MISDAGRKRILLIGAGGHAAVVADSVLRAAAAGEPVELVGFLDENAELHGTSVAGRPVLGGMEGLDEVDRDALIVAIGDNRVRAKVVEELRERGITPGMAVIHPAAVVAPDARIGAGVMISAAAVINTGTEIGDNAIINTGCTVDHHCRIGAGAHIAPGAHLGGYVSVGTGALVGIGCSVIPGCEIGDWAVVGAGAAVTGPVADNVTVVGVPARPL